MPLVNLLQPIKVLPIVIAGHLLLATALQATPGPFGFNRVSDESPEIMGCKRDLDTKNEFICPIDVVPTPITEDATHIISWDPKHGVCAYGALIPADLQRNFFHYETLLNEKYGKSESAILGKIWLTEIDEMSVRVVLWHNFPLEIGILYNYEDFGMMCGAYDLPDDLKINQDAL